MKEHFEQLQSHRRIALGWKCHSVTVGSGLRWIERDGVRVLQQTAYVRWRHDTEQHVGGGYYSREDGAGEWLDVPLVKEESE